MELSEKMEYLRMKPGDVLILKVTEKLSAEGVSQLAAAVNLCGERLGIKVMLLGYEVDVVGMQRPSLQDLHVA